MDVKPFEDQSGSRKEQVRDMFNEIAGSYDFLNHFLSFNTDKRWRKKLVKRIKKELNVTSVNNILDIATGTGDLAFALSKLPATKITGIDLSVEMLNVARKKAKIRKSEIEWMEGDSENLPYENEQFDFVTVAFGVRNFENLEKGLAEILRVLKPNGVFVILETSVPDKTPYKQGYTFYSKNILPLIGKIFSKDNVAYGYLSESAAAFPYGEALNNILKKTGFIDVVAIPQTFGVATIYSASKK